MQNIPMKKPDAMIVAQHKAQQRHLRIHARMLKVYHDDRAFSSQNCLENIDYDVPEISNEELHLGLKQMHRTTRDAIAKQVGHQELKKFSDSEVTGETKHLPFIDGKNQNVEDLLLHQSQFSDFTFNGEQIATEIKNEGSIGRNSGERTAACTLQGFDLLSKGSLTEIKTEKSANPKKICEQRKKLARITSRERMRLLNK